MGTATLAGVLAGIVVGGLLGRVVMRISGFTAGPALVGVRTSNGNVVGDITFEGTLALVLFVGVPVGLVGGVLYAAVEPWVRRLRPWHGLVYGAGVLVALGFTVLDPSNVDFGRFGIAPLNVAMFAALFLVFGVLIGWLFDRLRAIRSRPGRAARTADIFAWLALGPAVISVIAVAGSIGGLADPVIPITMIVAVLIATIARWRNVPALVGYGAVIAALALGFVRTAGALRELVAVF